MPALPVYYEHATSTSEAHASALDAIVTRTPPPIDQAHIVVLLSVTNSRGLLIEATARIVDSDGKVAILKPVRYERMDVFAANHQSECVDRAQRFYEAHN